MIYEFKNKETGEITEESMTYSERELYLEKNPHLSVIIRGGHIVSGTGSTIGKASDGWKDLLKGIKSGSGKSNTIKT